MGDIASKFKRGTSLEEWKKEKKDKLYIYTFTCFKREHYSIKDVDLMNAEYYKKPYGEGLSEIG